jgi:hypothetical protein
LLAGYGFQSTLNYFSEYSLDNTKVVWHEFIDIYVKTVLSLVSLSGYIFYFLFILNV